MKVALVIDIKDYDDKLMLTDIVNDALFEFINFTEDMLRGGIGKGTGPDGSITRSVMGRPVTIRWRVSRDT